MKYSYILFISLALIIVFLIGFVLGAKFLSPHQLIYSLKHSVLSQVLSKSQLQECTIFELEKLPDNYTVIIGHAYGKTGISNKNDSITESVRKFLIKNKNNIDGIIFTGDVFRIPSAKKWRDLFHDFSFTEVLVAPGNHDVQHLASRDVFRTSKFIKQDYPFEVSLSEATVILDDSVNSNWIADKKVIDSIMETASNEIIIARHNIVVSELLAYSNSQAAPSNLPSVEFFVSTFPENKKLTWIMGDGGAFSYLPRSSCHFFKNHRFIVNGLGGINGDTILIIYAGAVYQYILP